MTYDLEWPSERFWNSLGGRDWLTFTIGAENFKSSGVRRSLHGEFYCEMSFDVKYRGVFTKTVSFVSRVWFDLEVIKISIIYKICGLTYRYKSSSRYSSMRLNVPGGIRSTLIDLCGLDIDPFGC